MTAPAQVRVVKSKTSGNEHAEYLVVACLGSTLLASWKRYSQLMSWAEQAKRSKFERSIEAWEDVRGGKRVFRCLDPNYLRLKSHYLERFLQQLLFEVPSYHELLALFDSSSSNSKDVQQQESPDSKTGSAG